MVGFGHRYHRQTFANVRVHFGRLERGVVGETPNLAARLQALAEPGSVVLDGNTQKLERLISMSRELELPLFLAAGMIYLGGSRWSAGEHAARTLLEEGLAKARDIGFRSYGPHNQTLLAELEAGVGEDEVALARLQSNSRQSTGRASGGPLRRCIGCAEKSCYATDHRTARPRRL